MRLLRSAALLLALLLLLPSPSQTLSTALLKKLNASAATVPAAVAAVLDRANLPQPPYRLALCAVVRNEEFNIQEWVLYHFLHGVQHFYLFDNDSDDDTRDYLQPLVQLGLVTLKRAPGGEHRAALAGVLEECFATGGEKNLPTDWLAHWDVDEFLVLPAVAEVNLGALTGKDAHLFYDNLWHFEHEAIGAVVLHRMDFGSNGHDTAALGTVLEEYTERLIGVRPGGAQYGKVMVRLDSLVAHKGTHAPPELKNGSRASFVNTAAYVEGVQVPIFEPFRLNHYLTRSHEECMDKSTSLRTKGSWRRDAGAAMCETHRRGSKTWYRVEHGQNYDALIGGAVDVINALLPLLLPNNTRSRR